MFFFNKAGSLMIPALLKKYLKMKLLLLTLLAALALLTAVNTESYWWCFMYESLGWKKLK